MQREIKPGWLTGREQIAAYTGWSKRTVSRELKNGKFPFRRHSKKLIMVKVSDLDAALNGVGQ